MSSVKSVDFIGNVLSKKFNKEWAAKFTEAEKELTWKESEEDDDDDDEEEEDDDDEDEDEDFKESLSELCEKLDQL